MSKKFIQIGNSVFSKDDVISITQQIEEVKTTQTVAVVRFRDDEDDFTVILPEGKKLTDYVKAEDLNRLD